MQANLSKYFCFSHSRFYFWIHANFAPNETRDSKIGKNKKLSCKLGESKYFTKKWKSFLHVNFILHKRLTWLHKMQLNGKKVFSLNCRCVNKIACNFKHITEKFLTINTVLCCWFYASAVILPSCRQNFLFMRPRAGKDFSQIYPARSYSEFINSSNKSADITIMIP